MVVVGTVCTLLAFTFTRPPKYGPESLWGLLLGGAASVGRVFLTIAFGLAFAGALTASLSILVVRLQAFIDLVFQVIGR
jgi:hypothetical protein